MQYANGAAWPSLFLRQSGTPAVLVGGRWPLVSASADGTDECRELRLSVKSFLSPLLLPLRCLLACHCSHTLAPHRARALLLLDGMPTPTSAHKLLRMARMASASLLQETLLQYALSILPPDEVALTWTLSSPDSCCSRGLWNGSRRPSCVSS